MKKFVYISLFIFLSINHFSECFGMKDDGLPPDIKQAYARSKRKLENSEPSGNEQQSEEEKAELRPILSGVRRRLQVFQGQREPVKFPVKFDGIMPLNYEEEDLQRVHGKLMKMNIGQQPAAEGKK